MIKLEPKEDIIKFHYKKVSALFEKIITKKKGKNKLIDETRLFLKRYKNILISGRPYLLIKVDNKFKLTVNGQDDKKLKKFFSTIYKEFQSENSQEFLKQMDKNTCVYCNRNYTIQIVDNRASAQLDHWFPKDKFPILALSFFNLIPSCPSCNHIKSNNAPDEGWENALNNLNHPYQESNKFRFSYDYKSLDDFNLKIEVEKDSKTDNTLKFNRIEEIYSAHSNLELRDLVHLRSKYSDTFLNMVSNNFGGIMSKEEAYRIIFGVEEKAENFHKRPFSKFKTDIIDELLNDNKSKFES
ncbi:hypothetical protein AX766_11155 [Flavobacterium covae]|uniref:HNH endonuclease n=1 Tax=Flavobacterium TaxID=237 RepID=UPI0007C1A929|nr:HNH endonuclease [Flavobacterium covae]AND64904.1 hypothetical protein AX766_11155 [Flavobacterium covae]